MSQINDIKVRLKLTITEDGAALNVSTATSKSIIVKKPDGTVLNYSASFLTDGSDGVLYYDTISSDLNQVGTYKVQAEIILNSGTYRSSIGIFRTEYNI